MRLAPEVLARIDALVAPGKRADFIRAAVSQALDRAEASAAPDRPDPALLYAALSARGRSAKA